MVRTKARLSEEQIEKLKAVTAAREARLAAEAEYRRAVANADAAAVTKSAIAEAAGVSVEAIRTVLIRMASAQANPVPEVTRTKHVGVPTITVPAPVGARNPHAALGARVRVSH